MLEGHTGWVCSVAFSPDGQKLASGSSDNTMQVWDAASGKCLHLLVGHTSWVYSVAFSPDGQQLASGIADNTARIWDTASGECLRVLKSNCGAVKSLTYSPVYHQLACGCQDGNVRVWDMWYPTFLALVLAQTQLRSSLATEVVDLVFDEFLDTRRVKPSAHG